MITSITIENTKQEDGLEEEESAIELSNLMSIYNRLTYDEKVSSV